MSTADELTAWCASPGVPSALVAARDAVDALLRDRGRRRTTAELTTESLLRGAAASALLEGESTGTSGESPGTSAAYDDAVERLRDGDADPLALAAARLNAGVLALVPVVSRAPLQALARLHVLAATGLVADDRLGRPRADEAVTPRLHDLAGLLAAPPDVPGIALAAYAHAEVATLAPFVTGNGLVARALERLLLVSQGVDPSAVTVPEAGHLALADGYRVALSAYAGDRAGGAKGWLLHVADAIPAGVAASPLR